MMHVREIETWARGIVLPSRRIPPIAVISHDKTSKDMSGAMSKKSESDVMSASLSIHRSASFSSCLFLLGGGMFWCWRCVDISCRRIIKKNRETYCESNGDIKLGEAHLLVVAVEVSSDPVQDKDGIGCDDEVSRLEKSATLGAPSRESSELSDLRRLLVGTDVCTNIEESEGVLIS